MIKTINAWTVQFSFIVLFTLVSSCREYVKLTPAPQALEIADMNAAAVSAIAGVSVTVQAAAWKGATAIKREVTPLKVTIENNSGGDIRLSYTNFALISPTGEHFAALPPYAIEGSIEEPVTAEAHPGIISPRFYHHGFTISPYYSPFYDGLSVFNGPFYYDPYYYDRYYTYWEEIELPTLEMLQEALPEGVIEDKGKVIGFLYFETVSPDIKRVSFRMDVTNAKDGNILGSISIPFLVN